MDLPTLPMPNDEFEDGTVIASAWQNDDPEEGPLGYTLLILNPDPGYYSVVAVTLTDFGGTTHTLNTFQNIIPATESYSDEIGGY